MAKVPCHGLVKIRLHPLLGPHGAAALQALLIRQTCALVLFIGTDAPMLTTTILRHAGELLGDDEVDVVLGPALDGGYYAAALLADPAVPAAIATLLLAVGGAS